MIVDELFDRYKTAFAAGEDPDPAPYLQLAGGQRRELEVLIGGYLASMPARPYDPERLAGTPAGRLTQRVVERLMCEAKPEETWVTLLPKARNEAQILRQELARRLAELLGVSDKEAKVARYYHAMEQGRLPAHRVSDRVLRALAQIVDVPLERLRAAGQRLTPPPTGPMPAVFARRAAAPAAEASVDAASQEFQSDWDEVDELFAGGSGSEN